MELVIPAGETQADVIVPADLRVPNGLHIDEAAGLLVVNDGSDYEAAGLTGWLHDQIAAGHIPPYSLLLLGNGGDRRYELYSALPAYSHAVAQLIGKLMPDRAEKRQPVIGLASSLGAHAMLAMNMHCPGTADHMMLQSTTLRDCMDLHADDELNQLSRAQLARVVNTANGVAYQARHWPTMRFVMSCSNEEGNFPHNRKMESDLRDAGHIVDFTEIEGYQHDLTSWRELYYIGLPGLLLDAVRDYAQDRLPV